MVQILPAKIEPCCNTRNSAYRLNVLEDYRMITWPRTKRQQVRSLSGTPCRVGVLDAHFASNEKVTGPIPVRDTITRLSLVAADLESFLP
jgi:hypothetical protein